MSSGKTHDPATTTPAELEAARVAHARRINPDFQPKGTLGNGDRSKTGRKRKVTK